MPRANLRHQNIGRESLSIEDGAPGFAMGDFILVRIPKEIRVEGYVENEGTAVGTDLPLTSRGSSSQHFSSIRQASILSDSPYLLEVYPVLSFSRTG